MASVTSDSQEPDEDGAAGARPVDLAHASDFALGTINVRPSRRTLAGPNGEATLEPKVMQVMVALGRAGGATLSRDDLIERCWDGRAVGDTSINRVISLLRKGLSEAGGEAVSLENVPKVGYHLEVHDSGEPEPEPALEPAAAAPSGKTPASGQSHRMGILAAIVLLVGAIAAFVWWKPIGGGAPETARIAMLPVDADESVDYFFVQGLASELRSTLGQQPGLEVTSSNSAQQLIEAGLSPVEIGERLKVDFVWQARLMSDAESVRLDAQLYKVETGEIVWSQTTAGTPDASQTIPMRSARSMMEGLNRRFGPGANDWRLSDEDHRLFLLAKGGLYARDPSQTPQVLSILGQLTRRNPDFGPGWALFANARAWDFTGPETESEDERLSEARRYIAKALELAPDAPQVLSVAGLLAQDPQDARGFLERAIERDPGDPQTHFWLGHTRSFLGDYEGAVKSYENTLRLDPLWNRTGTVPEDVASVGLIGTADQWDRDIMAAAGDGWQFDAARSRIARRKGRWAEAIALVQSAAEKAPRGRKRWFQGRELLMRAYIGADLRPDLFPARWTAEERAASTALLQGELPQGGARALERLGDFWSTQIVTAQAPRVLYANGEGAELLRLFDEAFPEPAKTLRAKRGITAEAQPTWALPYALLAMRDAGRGPEAQELGALALRESLPDPAGLAPVGSLTTIARLEAIGGNAQRAIDALQKARVAGWPHTMGLGAIDVYRPITEDPAFATLRERPDFRAIAKAIEAERARERAAMAALGL